LPTDLSTVCLNGELTVQVTSSGGSVYVPSDAGARLTLRAQLATDYIEIVTRARLP
jgi:hypothetical protein